MPTAPSSHSPGFCLKPYLAPLLYQTIHFYLNSSSFCGSECHAASQPGQRVQCARVTNVSIPTSTRHPNTKKYSLLKQDPQTSQDPFLGLLTHSCVRCIGWNPWVLAKKIIVQVKTHLNNPSLKSPPTGSYACSFLFLCLI